MDKIPIDSDVRRSAVDPSRSFIVSAPAGSGKTGLLTLRVLNLLSVVNQPEEILCVTFTRKAAHEMHERIFSALREAQRMPPGSAQYHALDTYGQQTIDAASLALDRNDSQGWNLLKTPLRLNVSTIDSFCKQLCNQLPFFSGLGSGAGMISNPTLSYQQTVEAWLNNELTTPQKDGDTPPLSTLLEHVSGDLEKLVNLFTQLLSVRDQWLPLLYSGAQSSTQLKQFFEQTLTQWVESSIEPVLPYFLSYEAELSELAQYAYSHTDPDDASHDELARLQSSDGFVTEGIDAAAYWTALANFCLVKDKPNFRKQLTKKNGFPAGDTKEEKILAKEKKQRLLTVFAELIDSGLPVEIFSALRKLPTPIYQDAQWQVLSALLAVLPELIAHLKLHFIESAATDFTELSLSAVHALNSEFGDIDLQQRLDYTIQHILIDEFQDTSQIQLDLLKALTAEWQPNDGRSLFLVGDGMQSCYSFRNANVGIFLNLRALGLENIISTPIDLVVNFRSETSIVDWVNTTFRQAFPIENNADLGAVSYIDSVAFKADSDHTRVRCLAVYEPDDATISDTDTSTTQSDPALAEAIVIANEVIALRSSEPSESIAVLAKTRPQLTHIISVFIKLGIPYQALEIDRLRSKQHIQDIETLLKILLNPADKLAWLALLRSPICALNFSDIYYFYEPSQSDKFELNTVPIVLCALAQNNKNISARGRSALKRLTQSLSRYLVLTGRRPMSELLELLWLDMAGAEQLSNQSEIKDIHTFLALIDQHEQCGQLDWLMIDKALDTLFAAVENHDDNPVQLLTMHKSKGLEFDNVFLPALHKRPRADDPELLYWLERNHAGESNFVLSPMATNKECQDDISEYIKSQRKEKQKLEETRVFYVACTRAKRRLYLSAVLSLGPEGDICPPSSGTLLNRIWPSIEGSIEAINATTVQLPPQGEIQANTASLAIDSVPLAEAPSLKSLPPEWENKLLLDARTFVQKPDFDNTGIVLLDELGSSNLAAQLGTVFHLVLKLLCEQGLDRYRHNPERQHARWQQWMSNTGIPEEDIADHIIAFTQHTKRLIADQDAVWLLDNQHKDSRCEWALLDCNGSGQLHVIDRTFIAGGQRWLIDYKTSTRNLGQSLADFEQQEILAYTGQLQRYAAVLSSWDASTTQETRPTGLRVALFFPFEPHLLRVPSLDIDYDQ